MKFKRVGSGMVTQRSLAGNWSEIGWMDYPIPTIPIGLLGFSIPIDLLGLINPDYSYRNTRLYSIPSIPVGFIGRVGHESC